MRSKKTPVILLEQPGFKADSFTNYGKEDPPNKQLTPTKSWTPNNGRGHAGHGLGPGHSWLMQLGLSGKWLSKQRPEWLPLAGTSALSLLIHSKEPQSNTQRHTVTNNNIAWSEGTRNESHWPKLGDRRQFTHHIWVQNTVWLSCGTGQTDLSTR